MKELAHVDDRVVITGLGALTPLGNTWRDTWYSLKNGTSGVTRITQFDASDFSTRIAAEVKGFDPEAFLSIKQVRRTSRTSQLAVVAAREAIADAGLEPDFTSVEAAVVVNSAVSGFTEIEQATELLTAGEARRISPRFVPSALTNMAACEIAIDLGIHGPVNASALACASGAYALLEARTLLLEGDADIVIAGGTDAAITPVMFAGLSAMHALSKNNDSPEEASRPFDADRDGFVFGEGAVIFVMELLSHARARGAHVYAEVLGGALTSDGFNVVAPDPTAKYASLAISRALAKAKLTPGDIDVICAHGTSTQANDRTETLAIQQAFGEAAGRVAVTAPKSMTGHLIGAAGALAGLVCALSIQEGVIPPTINYTTPDPDCPLDYVPLTAREQPVRFALTNAFGFGGQNCAVAFGAV
jgi:3-oxoacyl-[acyl-carrier-protein] synthase II